MFENYLVISKITPQTLDQYWSTTCFTLLSSFRIPLYFIALVAPVVTTTARSFVVIIVSAAAFALVVVSSYFSCCCCSCCRSSSYCFGCCYYWCAFLLLLLLEVVPAFNLLKFCAGFSISGPVLFGVLTWDLFN